jgi:hypothetical protein
MVNFTRAVKLLSRPFGYAEYAVKPTQPFDCAGRVLSWRTQFWPEYANSRRPLQPVETQQEIRAESSRTQKYANEPGVRVLSSRTQFAYSVSGEYANFFLPSNVPNRKGKFAYSVRVLRITESTRTHSRRKVTFAYSDPPLRRRGVRVRELTADFSVPASLPTYVGCARVKVSLAVEGAPDADEALFGFRSALFALVGGSRPGRRF